MSKSSIINASLWNIVFILYTTSVVYIDICVAFVPSVSSSNNNKLISTFKTQQTRHITTPYTSSSSSTSTTSLYAIEAVTVCKDQLVSLLSLVPSGLPTPKSMTNDILNLVTQLELKCPTNDQDVLTSLQGSWELLWTAQDTTTIEANNGMKSWIINPFENQIYSNNPQGRSNPFLPAQIQNQLEALGLISATPIRSTQAIDTKRGIIRNVVALNLGPNRMSSRNNKNDNNNDNNKSNSMINDNNRRSRTFSQSMFNSENNNNIINKNNLFLLPTRASMSVTIGFEPVVYDPRRVDVKFQSIRISVPGTPIQMDMPLGNIGPSGWLRTVYVDDDFRISRGHKGSVFVLSRPRRATV